MNETMTLPQLISRLASEANCNPATARRFIHDLFAEVEQALSEGRSITIPGIGEFVAGMDTANPVLFRPDAMLAAALNEPFEAFTAVEIPPEMTDMTDSEPEAAEPEIAAPAQPETIAAVSEPALESEPLPVEDAEPEPEPVESEPNPNPKPTPATEIEPQEEDALPADTQQPVEVQPELPVETSESEVGEPVEGEVAPAHHSTGMLLTCGILIGLIIGLIGGYFAGNAVGRYHIPDEEEEYYDEPDTSITEVTAIAAVEPVESVTDTAAQPASDKVAAAPVTEAQVASSEPDTQAKQPVYDTITSTQFLTTLARKHYGVKNYWIFIYEANPNLGNPNNIRPGTRLLIPDRSEFEEATPEETRAKAQQHLNRLAGKYKL